MRVQYSLLNMYHKTTKVVIYFKTCENRQFNIEGEIKDMKSFMDGWNGTQFLELSRDFKDGESFPLADIKFA